MNLRAAFYSTGVSQKTGFAWFANAHRPRRLRSCGRRFRRHSNPLPLEARKRAAGLQVDPSACAQEVHLQ